MGMGMEDGAKLEEVRVWFVVRAWLDQENNF